MTSIWKPMLASAALLALATGCEQQGGTGGAQEAINEEPLAEVGQQEEELGAEPEYQAGRTGAVSAVGEGHVYEIRRIEGDTIYLEPIVAGMRDPAEKPMTLSFSEFEQKVDKNIKFTDPKQLEEDMNLGIYRDGEGRISKIIVERNVDRKGGEPVTE